MVVQRVPGGPWTVAGAALVVGAGAFVLGASGVRGAVLHGAGWPLLVALVALFGVVKMPDGPGRPRGPVMLTTFAFFFGWFTLFQALVFGPEDYGFLPLAVGGVVSAGLITGFFEILTRREHRRILARREATARIRGTAP